MLPKDTYRVVYDINGVLRVRYRGENLQKGDNMVGRTKHKEYLPVLISRCPTMDDIEAARERYNIHSGVSA